MLFKPAVPVTANEGTTEVDEQPTNTGAVAPTPNLEDENSGVGEEPTEVEVIFGCFKASTKWVKQSSSFTRLSL